MRGAFAPRQLCTRIRHDWAPGRGRGTRTRDTSQISGRTRVKAIGPWRGNPGNIDRISALGRYARNYSGETLRMAASDLVDLSEAKDLDRDALVAIAAALFGVTNLY